MFSALILAAAISPLVEMFPREVTFYHGFDDGVNPAIGMTGQGNWKNFHLSDDGLIGKCLDIGTPGYNQNPAQPLIDTTKPGSVVIWAKLLCEQKPIVKGLAKWEGGGGLFEAMGNGCRMLIMKSVDHHWGDGAVWVFFEGRDEHGAHFSTCARAHCSFTDWKVGEWRMIAAAWTAEKLYISVNGKPFASAPYNKKMGALRGGVYFKAGYWNAKDPKPGMFAIDECAIINRKLSDDELAEIYARTLKLSGK